MTVRNSAMTGNPLYILEATRTQHAALPKIDFLMADVIQFVSGRMTTFL